MRVALIHDWLTGMRGWGEVSQDSFCELFSEGDLYTLIYPPENISPSITGMKIHASWLGLPCIDRYYR